MAKPYHKLIGTKTEIIHGQEVEVKVYAEGKNWDEFQKDKEKKIRQLGKIFGNDNSK